MSTVKAAGHTWYWVNRPGPGCWHRDDPGGRCLSTQGLLSEHAGWCWVQAREAARLRNRARRWLYIRFGWFKRHWEDGNDQSGGQDSTDPTGDADRP